MRNRLLVLGSVLVLSGCTGGASAVGALPPVRIVTPPAASAGGACILWDFAEIEQRLGVRFDVAAAGEADDTSTCVVQADGPTRPDLVLSVVEQAPADLALYRSELMPERATIVQKLGKAAYRLVGGAADDHGPTAEVGWLTADRQLMTLRFTYPAGASTADADEMAAKLVDLARSLADT